MVIKPDDDVWHQFSERHPHHPFLKLDPLLTVDPELLKLLQTEFSTIISVTDSCFEADLHALVETGFYFRRPIGLREKKSEEIEEMRRDLPAMRDEELKRKNYSEAEVAELRQGQESAKQKFQEVGEAYCGWLLCNAAYQKDLRCLKAKCGIHVDALQRIPSMWDIPPKVLPEQARNRGNYSSDFAVHQPQTDSQESTFIAVSKFLYGNGPQFLDELEAFYRKWELFGLPHWELPVPALPAMATPLLPEETQLRLTSMTWSIPWLYLRDNRIRLDELLKLRRDLESPQHLKTWLKTGNSPKSKLGPVQYALFTKLHKLILLTILPRYGKKKGFTLDKLYHVLGNHLSSEPETIRKAYGELNKALKTEGDDQ